MAEVYRTVVPKQSVYNKNPGSIYVAGGTITMDGSNPTPVNCLTTHGIKTVLGALVQIKDDGSAPGDDPTYATCSWTGATLNLYAWKNTSGTDPTFVASTDSAHTFVYQVWGEV